MTEHMENCCQSSKESDQDQARLVCVHVSACVIGALPLQNMLRRHEELENGTAWSNSSESSDDSYSPQLSTGGQHNSTQHTVTHNMHKLVLCLCTCVVVSTHMSMYVYTINEFNED